MAVIVGLLWLASCSLPTGQVPPSPRTDTAVSIADTTASIDRPKKNKTIALLGATGMVGGFILQQALREGYDIRALARTPAKLDALKNRITLVKGDARDLSTIQQLLRGSDVVISALGPVKADGAAADKVSTIATGHIIEVMQQQNIDRYIVVSGAAVTMPTDKRNLMGWLIKKMAQMTLYNAVLDKQAEYQLLADSSIQWTLVRCPLIDAQPFRRDATVALGTPPSFNVRAGELARFLIEQIESQEYIRQGPFLGSL